MHSPLSLAVIAGAETISDFGIGENSPPCSPGAWGTRKRRVLNLIRRHSQLLAPLTADASRSSSEAELWWNEAGVVEMWWKMTVPEGIHVPYLFILQESKPRCASPDVPELADPC